MQNIKKNRMKTYTQYSTTDSFDHIQFTVLTVQYHYSIVSA